MGYGGYGNLGGCCCEDQVTECPACNTGTLPKSWMVKIEGMPESPACEDMWNNFDGGDCIHINGTYFIDITTTIFYVGVPNGVCAGSITVPVTCGGTTIHVQIALMFRGSGTAIVSCRCDVAEGSFPQPWVSGQFTPKSVMYFSGHVPEVDSSKDCSLFDGWTKSSPVFHVGDGFPGSGFARGKFCESTGATVTVTAV